MVKIDNKGVLQPIKETFQWTIERFFADCKKVGESYLSPYFPVGYTKWYLEIYPRGEVEEWKDYVSLYLHSDFQTNTELTITYEASVLTECNIEFEFKESRDTFKGLTDNWGWEDFIKQETIKDKENGILINDTLKIMFKINFSQLVQDVAKTLQDYNYLLDSIDKGLQDYEELFESSRFSDVTFIVQEQKLHLHKNILSCRNPTFKAMFESNVHVAKKQKVMTEAIKITDISYEVMKEMCRFIYCGKVENIEKIAKDLVIAADKYSVLELKSLCELTILKTLYADLTVDNIIQYLKLVPHCNTIHLKTPVIEFAVDHHKDVMKMPGFAEINSNVMFEIMQKVVK